MKKLLVKATTVVLSLTLVMSTLFSPSVFASSAHEADKAIITDESIQQSNNIGTFDANDTEFDMELVLFEEPALQQADFLAESAEKAVELSFEIEGLESTTFPTFNVTQLPSLESFSEIDLDAMSESIDVGADHLVGGNSRQQRAAITPFNTNPNIAIHIPDSLFGLNLQDLANNQERWYSFIVSKRSVISIAMSYQSGQYGMVLFSLDGGFLNAVDVAANGSRFERINYLTDGGIYFLAVVPFVPASVPHFFSFAIDAVPDQTSTHSNSIDIHARLNSGFDENWHRINVTTAGKREIAVFNAPTGHYGVAIYDGNLNLLGSFIASNAPRSMNFTTGTYFVRVFSYTGQWANSDYWLVSTNAKGKLYDHNGQIYVMEPGDVGLLDERTDIFYRISPLSNGIAINGVQAPISGTFRNGKHEFSVHTETVKPSKPRLVYVDDVPTVTFEIDVGFMRYPMPHLLPPFWYYITYPSNLYGKQTTQVDGVTVFVSLETGRIFHAEWWINTKV
jgi:hypothetical protein